MTTKIWNGASADWSVGTDWTPNGVPGTADVAVLNGGAAYLVSIGTSTTTQELEQAGTLLINDANATLAVAPGSTLAAGLIELQAGTLYLAAFEFGPVLLGGTLALAGGVLSGDYPTLDGVTVFGDLGSQKLTNYQLSIVGGLTIDTPTGAPDGTLSLNEAFLTILDSETLDNATFVAKTSFNSIDGLYETLTLGQHLTLAVGSEAVSVYAASLTNYGTIDVAAGGVVSLSSNPELGAGGGSLVNDGVISIAAGGTLSVSETVTAAGLQTLLAGLTDLGTLLLQGTLLNTGSVLSAGTIGALELEDTVIGGTIVNSGAVSVFDAVLSGVTMEGPLVLAAGYDAGVQLAAGTTLLSASGAAPGTVIVGGNEDYLALGSGETLDNALVEVTGQDADIYAAAYNSPLLFGSGLDLLVTGSAVAYGSSLVNAGTITVAAGGVLDIELNTLVNSGGITVAAGGTLELDVEQFSAALGNGAALSGSLPALAAGASLVVGNSLTTAQLLSLVSGETGVVVEVLGTLNNAGNTLAIGAGSPISDLILHGLILGGTIDNVGGTVALGGGTLDAVTVLGPAGFNTEFTTADVLGGFTLLGTDGTSPGALSFAGDDALVALGNETLDNLVISAPTITNGYEIVDAIYGSTLTLGAHVTLLDRVDTELSAATLSNAGTLLTAGTGSEILLVGSSIANSGVISIGSGDDLGVDVNNYGESVAEPTSLTNTGTIALTGGAALELGGTAASSVLLALLGTQTGVNIFLSGTLLNAGNTLDATANGTLAHLSVYNDVAPAALIGGTLIGAGGTVDIAGLLDAITVQGAVTLDGSSTLTGGVAFSGVGGSGLASLTLRDTSLTLLDAETIANVAIAATGAAYYNDLIAQTPILSIGATTTISLPTGDGVTFTGGTVVNAGTIIAAPGSAAATVQFASATIVQAGVVSLGSGDVLGLDVSNYGVGLGGTLDLIGSFNLAAGVTLDLGEQQTTGQLTTLLSQIGAAGDTVELPGTLRNSAATLAVGSSLLSAVQLSGDIIGGVITQSGGSLTFLGGTLDGVQIDAPVTLTGGLLHLVDSPGFDNAAGQPGGSIAVTANSTIQILDSESIDHVGITVGTGDELTFEAGGTYGLNLGVGAVLQVQGEVVFDAFESAITTAATIAVTAGTAAYTPSELTFEASTITNTGTIGIGAGGLLALDGFNQPIALSNTAAGLITLAAGATLDIAGVETTAQLATLLGEITGTGYTLALGGSIVNAGTSLDFATGAAYNEVLLNGSIIGGTVIDAGVSIDFQGAVLAATTWDGPLTLAKADDNLTLVKSLALYGAGGTVPGTLAVSGNDADITATNLSLFDQATLAVSGNADLLSITTLTLGPAAQVSVSGALSIDGTELINDGSIAVAGSLTIDANSLVNAGIITVGSGDVLGITAGSAYAPQSLSVSNTGTGSFSLAAGSTLVVGGSLTTAQLLTLLGEISNTGVTVELTGTIVNTGATLGAGVSPLLQNMILDADIVGGVIAPGAGSAAVIGGTLNGVTWQGTLGLRGYDELVSVLDGLTLTGSAGSGAGTLLLGGEFSALDILDSETLSNALILASGFEDSLTAGSLALASGVSLAVSGELQLAIGTLSNAGSISVSGSAGQLALTGTSLVNNGILTVGSLSLLELGESYGASLSISGNGSVAIAPGATLAIGGSETTAQLLAQLATLSQPGVTVELTGTIVNTNATLDAAAAGLLGHLVFNNADIIGGIIDADTGSVTIENAVFDHVTYLGTLAVTGRNSELDVLGSLTLESTLGLLPGTIDATSAGERIAIEGSNPLTGTGTLSNVVLTGTSAYFGILGPMEGTLDLASSVVSDVSGILALNAGDVVNAGTFLVGGSGSALLIAGTAFSNTGDIIVGAGAAIGFDATANFSNTTGTIALASGATLGIGSTLTPGELEAFTAPLVINPGIVVGVGLTGTLVNTGTTFTITPSGSLSDVAFGLGGMVIGGTVYNDGVANFLGDAIFDAVSWVGPATLALPGAELDLAGGASVTSASSAPASIGLYGTSDELVFDPAYVPDYGTPTAGAMQTVTNTVITLAGGGTTTPDTVLFEGPGSLTLAAGVTLLASANAVLEVTGTATLRNQGSVLGSGGLLSIESYGTGSSVINTGVISATGVTAGSEALLIGGAFTNAGLIEVSGPVRGVIEGRFGNIGSLLLAQGATIELSGTGLNAGTIALQDGAESVRIDTAGVTASLAGFQAGDTIDLRGLGTIAAGFTYAAGTLDVYNGSSLFAALTLPTDYAYGNSFFALAADQHGGSDITTTTPCFLAGTRIRTTEGEIAVEALRVGMRVPTLTGARPIMWIGERRIDCARHRTPRAVLPVRVCRDAFGAGLPQRDLLLSPDHAIWHDGVLIPIQYLVNGVTIRRETVARAHYYHVELDAHAVLFAEGLPAESYLDTGNRGDFANGAAAISLFADFAARASNEACAPLCVRGPVLAALRRRMFAPLASVEIAAPVLRAGGRELSALPARGEVLRVHVPAGVDTLTLLSQTAVPAELDPNSADQRELGVAVGGVVLNGRVIDLGASLLGAGFHPIEAGRRWTNGAAYLQLGVSRAQRTLELRIVARMRRRVPSDAPKTRRQGLLF